MFWEVKLPMQLDNSSLLCFTFDSPGFGDPSTLNRAGILDRYSTTPWRCLEFS